MGHQHRGTATFIKIRASAIGGIGDNYGDVALHVRRLAEQVGVPVEIENLNRTKGLFSTDFQITIWVDGYYPDRPKDSFLKGIRQLPGIRVLSS